MKAKIVTFSLKGKVDIWWEDDLIWDVFERHFKKKYLSERYYDDRAKDSCAYG